VTTTRKKKQDTSQPARVFPANNIPMKGRHAPTNLQPAYVQKMIQGWTWTNIA